MTYLLSFIFGFLIGLPMGGLGGGGGVLLFPLLVYGIGLAPKVAIAHSIVIVGCTCFFAFMLYIKERAFRLREATILATLGAIAAQAGAYATALVTEQLILFAASALLFSVAFLMFRSAADNSGGAALENTPLWIYVPIGLFVGFVTGFLGVGGGFLLVPACTLVGGMSVSTAAGTALLVGLLNSISGHLAHQETQLDMGIVSTFLLASCISSALARSVARKAPEALLKKVFASLLGLIGAGMLFDAVI